MPPKRKSKKDEESAVPSSQSDQPELKKQKTDVIQAPSISTSPVAASSSTSSSLSKSGGSDDDDSSSLPPCVYGVKCYRKNPDHFKQFSHPKGGSNNVSPQASRSASVVSSSPPPKAAVVTTPPSTSTAPPSSSTNLESYRLVLKVALDKGRISADDKRLMRSFRKNHNISDEDHFSFLKKFGWSEEEYDDGEKKEDDIDLEEEKKYIDNNEYTVITIKKEDANKKKEYLNVFSKVSTQFYETMSEAQANFSVSEVSIVVNPELRKKFLSKKQEMADKLNVNLHDVEELFGFHGTTRDSIKAISKTNFLTPDDLAKLKLQSQKQTKGKGKKKVQLTKPVELLDDGYFGKGIYFTLFSDYALWYSSERESDQVLLCKLLPGKRYKCSKRMDGQGLMKGYDCHSSPKGNEVVLFSTDQILPRYIITFVSNKAEEREQES